MVEILDPEILRCALLKMPLPFVTKGEITDPEILRLRLRMTDYFHARRWPGGPWATQDDRLSRYNLSSNAERSSVNRCSLDLSGYYQVSCRFRIL